MTQADGTVRCRSYATLGELLSSNVRQEALPDQASLGTRLAPIFLVNHLRLALAQSQPQVIDQESKDLRETIARLNERLDEPFVTAGTVTGDKGIKQEQDEYQRLMNNKSPKSKRK